MKPTIVINAYKRPESLRRLLKSVSNAAIPSDAKLVFSIEYNADEDVLKQIENFDFVGEKILIKAEEKRGLIGHYFYCGNLTETYDSIIYLEDDLVVSPSFYSFSESILKAYGNDENIAGISLNALWFNGYSHFPFKPIEDGNPVFFLKSAWFQGQIYTKKQWKPFYDWYAKQTDFNYRTSRPEMKQLLNNDDWFPMKSKYLVEQNKYYCFTRNAYTVNFGDAGTNFDNSTNYFQTLLALDWKEQNFYSMNESKAVYDDFFELERNLLIDKNKTLKDYDFELDLNGLKNPELYQSEYWLSPFQGEENAMRFGLEMYPPENNIIFEIAGNHFFLTKRKDLKISKKDRLKVWYKHFRYHYRSKITLKQKLYILLKAIK